MAAPFRVALLQTTPAGRDLDGNANKGEQLCRAAAALGCDVALFPEMWSIGYLLPDPNDPAERESWLATGVSIDHPFVRRFQLLAKELKIAIAITFLEAFTHAPRNSVALVDRNGEIVLTYAKIHTCAFDRESQLTPGDAFPTVSLDTANGTVNVGCMICFDREFPETARILMLNGAEIILIPNACDLESHRTAQLRTRAYENMVGVAMTNYAAPRNNGMSMAFSPICFDPNGIPVDNELLIADEKDGIRIVEFDMDAIRNYCSREVWGEQFRHPDLYGRLT